ncbi:MAG: citrate lyase subunit beta/citryl-CoA lyase [Halieaceae bacterium]|jgi:citrate lyase subunit beta/citryl-CoA lyase
MTPNSRPLRSTLYMPGSNLRALEKAKTLPVDALIFDLEDSVSPDKKALARDQVVAASQEGQAGAYGYRQIVIRCNSLNSEWGKADLRAAAAVAPQAILLSKVNSAKDIDQALSILESEGLDETTAIWAMMETPLSILHAEEIAAASPRMGGLVMGTSDLVKDIHARHTRARLPVIASLNLCVLAARAYQLLVLDGVYLDLEDEAGFEVSCEQGLDLGFDGKTLIHPKQIELANAVFAPDAAELEFALRIIAAHAEAESDGRGVVLLDGKLIENLHVQDAHRIVALSAAIATMSI